LAFPGKEGLELSLGAAPTLEALGEKVSQLETCASFDTMLQRLRNARDYQPEVPTTLTATLRPYQHEGFRWLARLCDWWSGGGLADDMGLGKTLQTLGLLLLRAQRGPALVVAPTSVCFNWEKEAARFAHELRVISYRYSDRASLLGQLGAGDVVLASYGL